MREIWDNFVVMYAEGALLIFVAIQAAVIVVLLARARVRARTEHALREGSRRFRYLADRPPVIIWSARLDGTLDYLNNTAVEFTGQAIEKLLENGWLDVYSTLPSAEFQGKSRIGIFCDSMMELDHRTGQVLDAIKAAGIEDNTNVIWVSDNGSTSTEGSPESRGSSSGPFLGETGDALEGTGISTASAEFGKRAGPTQAPWLA